MKKKLILLCVISGFILNVNLVLAQNNNLKPVKSTINNTDSCSSSSCKLANPLGEGTTMEVLVARIINSVLGVVGSLALLMFIYGGLTWMTSAGSQEKIKKGQGIIIWSALGLVVIFSSYAAIRFVLTTIASK